jgi:hypothetical protein
MAHNVCAAGAFGQVGLTDTNGPGIIWKPAGVLVLKGAG